MSQVIGLISDIYIYILNTTIFYYYFSQFVCVSGSEFLLTLAAHFTLEIVCSQSGTNIRCELVKKLPPPLSLTCGRYRTKRKQMDWKYWLCFLTIKFDCCQCTRNIFYLIELVPKQLCETGQKLAIYKISRKLCPEFTVIWRNALWQWNCWLWKITWL